MPGGKGNINGAADGVPFTSTNQPKNRRKSTKFLTDLLTKNLKGKKEITVDGIDAETGLPAKIRVPMPTRQIIVRALLRQAAKGNMIAIKEIFDRTEGKSVQALELSGKNGQAIKTSQVHEVIFKKFSDNSVDNDNNPDV